MNEERGNLWEYSAQAIVITTNGFVKKDGRCVMGKGCAKEALRRYPDIDKVLGNYIRAYGNKVGVLNVDPVIMSFPVKPVSVVFDGTNAATHMKNKFNVGDVMPGWAAIADIELIEESAKQLKRATDILHFKSVVMPRPGCGAGELKWRRVKKVLNRILDDRFTCITY